MKRLLSFLALSGLLTLLVRAGEEKAAGVQSAEKPVPVEIVSRRSEFSETFDNRDGTFRSRVYSARKYYIEDNKYKPVNLAVTAEAAAGFTRAVKAGPYTLRYDSLDSAKGVNFARGEWSVTYTPEGDWSGVTSAIKPHASGIKEEVRLADASDSTVCWRVSTNAVVEFRDGGLVFTDTKGEFLFCVPPASAVDALGMQVRLETTFKNSMLCYHMRFSKDTAFPVTLDPSTTVDAIRDGTVKVSTSNRTTWPTCRDAAAGDITMSDRLQMLTSFTGTYYYLSRSFLSFPVNLGATAVVDSAFLYLDGRDDGSTTDFTIYAVRGTQTGTISTSWYIKFVGRNTGTDHTPAYLTSSWSTANFSTGWNKLTFTAAGRDSIEAVNGDTLEVCLLNYKWDIDNIAPTQANNYVQFENSSTAGSEPYLDIYYTIFEQPTGFAMTALGVSSIACSWNDECDHEQKYYILNRADSTVVDSTAANAEADTVYGLSANTKYMWLVAADSAGVRLYSNADTCYALLNPPAKLDVAVMPISSDTLKIKVQEPPNAASGSTGMDVDAVSGSGATDSGWLTGTYSYLDGGVNRDSTYVYRARYRNGDGIATSWSPNRQHKMNGLASLTIYLAGDLYDDYNVNFGAGCRDSTVVRAGKSDAGQRLDGFLSFELPWQVHKGGVDSLFLSVTRAAEAQSRTPSLKLYGIPVKDINPVETINTGAQDSTTISLSWTVSSGTGVKKTQNLRDLFRKWQDLSPWRDRTNGFGLRLDDNSQADSVRAVFLDYSNSSYSQGTYLTIYYTPGSADSLDAAPASFSLSVEAPDTIQASWTDNSLYELGYVLLNVADSTNVAGVDTLAENAVNIRVGSLTPNTVYQWFVRAFSAVNDSSASGASARTLARTPGIPTVTALLPTALKFIINPLDNPSYTAFAVEDSISGLYVDSTGSPDTLRAGPPADWGWRTFSQWGGALGDTLTALRPDSLYVIRVKARSGE